MEAPDTFTTGYLLSQARQGYVETDSVNPNKKSRSRQTTSLHDFIQNETSDCLKLNYTMECEELKFNTAPKMWGSIKLDALSDPTEESSAEVDFIIVIDRSSSMACDGKLANIKATIHFLLSKLDHHHRFCLIQFNHELEVMTEELLIMNNENKKKVHQLLKNITANGSTNISDPLLKAIEIIRNRKESERSRISTIMLFTDGISKGGLQGNKLSHILSQTKIPQTLTINTFGYGLSHDSYTLQNISFSSQGGVYHYVENVEDIATHFAECVTNILSTTVHNVTLRLVGQDGCRIVNFYTKYPVLESKPFKDYSINIGSIFGHESKSILFKLSLRKMDQELEFQDTLHIAINYTNSRTGVDHTLNTICSVSRPSSVPVLVFPPQLDCLINRYNCVTAIDEATKRSRDGDFDGARKKLEEAIFSVQGSSSSKDDDYRDFCGDLIHDLVECYIGMEDTQNFMERGGVHYAHSYSSMYHMERCNGSGHLIGVSDETSRNRSVLVSSLERLKQKMKRSVGYGYTSKQLEEAGSTCRKQAKCLLPSYSENICK